MENREDQKNFQKTREIAEMRNIGEIEMFLKFLKPWMTRGNFQFARKID